MASPQKEDGYTSIANEILEQIARVKLNGTQFRILFIVWRYTYGFNRKEHGISEGFISKAIGVAIPHVSREMKILYSRNILLTKKSSSFNSPAVIAFNKNYEEWQQLLDNETVAGLGNTDETVTLTGLGNTENTVTVTENGNTTVTENGNTTVTGLGNQERKIKEKEIYITVSDETAVEVFFESVWKLIPSNRNDAKGKVKPARKKQLMAYGYDKVKQACEEYLSKQEPAFLHKRDNFFNNIIDNYLVEDPAGQPPSPDERDDF